MSENDLTSQLKQAGILSIKTAYGCANYKCYSTEEQPDSAYAQEKIFIHCSHGFGASGISWVYFMKHVHNLTDHAQVNVIAHDTYGFGFTDRGEHDLGNDAIELSRVTLEANGQVAVSILSQFIIARSGGEDDKSLFFGHSMGSISAICSAVEWVESGRECNGVLLVAPAIQAGESNKDANAINIFFGALGAPLAAIFSMLDGISSLSFRRGSVRSLLTVVVNIPFFWYLGLRYAFSGPPLSTSIAYYQAPMKRNNWRDLLVDFIEANVWQRHSIYNESIHSKIQKLITCKVPIIIVHSPSDTFVPYKNSERLVEQFGAENIKLESVNDGGHMPHEKIPHVIYELLQKYNILK